MGILTTLHNHKKLLLFTIFSYVDKLIIFILPLIILYVSQDKLIYNQIEYVYSIANIFVVILNFIPIYSFYAYKVSSNRNTFISEIKNYNWITLSCLIIISLIGYPIAKSLPQLISLTLYCCICIRIFYLLFINYFSSYFRLIDIPIRILFISISVNLLSIFLILLITISKLNIILEAFFIPQLFVLFYFRKDVINSIKKSNFFSYINFLRKSYFYSLPLIISALIVAFVGNYGKIYAYNFLSSYEMYCFSYVMRISMIIQMAHASIIAFYGKQLFVEGYTKRIVKQYMFYILVSVALSFCFLFMFNSLFPIDKIPINATVFLILLYTIFYCIAAFIELSYNRNALNYKILYFSIISSILFLFLIFYIGVNGLLSLSIYMLSYSALYLFLLFYFRNKTINA